MPDQVLTAQTEITKTQFQGSNILLPILAGSGVAADWLKVSPGRLYEGLIEGWLLRSGPTDPTTGEKVAGKPGVYVNTTDGTLYYHTGTSADNWLELGRADQTLPTLLSLFGGLSGIASGDYLRYYVPSGGTAEVQPRSAGEMLRELMASISGIANNDYIRYTKDGSNPIVMQGRSSSEVANDSIKSILNTYSMLRRGSDGSLNSIPMTSAGGNPGHLKLGNMLAVWGYKNITDVSNEFETTVSFGHTFGTLRSVLLTTADGHDGGGWHVRSQAVTTSSVVVRFEKTTSGDTPPDIAVDWLALGDA